MENIILDGYCLPHIETKPWPSILREKRVTLRMTQQQVADKAFPRVSEVDVEERTIDIVIKEEEKTEEKPSDTDKVQ